MGYIIAYFFMCVTVQSIYHMGAAWGDIPASDCTRVDGVPSRCASNLLEIIIVD